MPLQLVALHNQAPFQLPDRGVVSIGRRPTNTVVCNDISVSGKHCEISIEAGVLRISDCSTNGTYINDERILRGDSAELRVGDVMALTKPQPPGTQDATVEPPLRVQFRLETLALRTVERQGTTAEGFAQDLLVQEQQCKAKITGELLLARRRLDEERGKSEVLARDLRRARQQLEEERRRRGAATELQQQTRAEALKLKDHRRQLPDMRSMHLRLQEKHEALELELSTAAQKASTLEGAVARLREDIQAVPAAEGKTLEEAQEALNRAQREAESLEASLAEAKRHSEAAVARNEKMQQELQQEKMKKERLEDQQALLGGEAERGEKAAAQAQELLTKATEEIKGLEERTARHRLAAEEQRAAAEALRRQRGEQAAAEEKLREACARFGEALRGCAEKWLSSLPEGEVLPMQAPPPVAPKGPEPAAAAEASEDSAETPSGPPPVPPPDSPETGRAPAQRLWSVAVLGGGDSLGLLESPKRQRVSVH